MADRSTTIADVLRTLGFYGLASLAAIPFILLFPLIFLPFPVYRLGIVPYLRIQLWILKHVGGISYRVTGWENLPAAPFIFASQHQATWENLYFQYILGNPAMFAKAEIFGYPLAGTVARRNGHIMVRRKGSLTDLRTALEQGVERLNAGRNVLIYPSGTRTKSANAPLSHGVAALYRKSGRPVVPILLDSGKYWRLGSWIKHKGEIQVQIMPPIPPGLSAGDFFNTLGAVLSRQI
jgi:1-acyl-sn-glycerol-3-phosphate acyltransferase